MMLVLRPAQESDVPLIQTLAGRIWHACYADLLSEAQRNYMLAWMYAPQKLTTEIRRGVHYRVAEVAGEPVGYLAWESLEDGVITHLHKLYLLPEWHGRGLGQAMVREVIAAAEAGRSRFLDLRVNQGNARALRAYQRAGFETVGKVVTDIGGGFVMNDYRLRRVLTASDRASEPRSDTSGPPSE